MSRKWTYPCEFGLGTGGSSADLEGFVGGGTPTIDTVLKRSPGASYKCDSGAGNTATHVRGDPALGAYVPGAGVTNYVRFYFCFTNLPGSTVPILRIQDGGQNLVSARLTSAGKLQLFDDVNGVQIGSDSAATIVADGATQYRVELAWGLNTSGANDFQELKLDGTTVATGTLDTRGSWAANFIWRAGWITAPGANKVLNIDDGAVNDSNGVNQNSYPGAGNVIASYPVSDSSRVGFTGGAGGTTSLFDALDNRPPVGVALGSATNTSQIKDLANNTTDNYVANVTDYTTAGLPGGATVTLVQPVAEIGQDSGASSFGITVVTNPAGSEDTGSGYTGAVGTWDSFWAALWGAAIVSPSVTPGTQPTVKLRKNTASGTVTQMACLLALVTEYTPAAAGGTLRNLGLLGVGS